VEDWGTQPCPLKAEKCYNKRASRPGETNKPIVIPTSSTCFRPATSARLCRNSR
jgi:hypothetical protein